MKPELRDIVEPGSEEAELLARLDMDRLPRHVAVIMDGNGRWAAQRRRPRVFGHRQGLISVREVVETSARLGVGVLTLYAFSRENWKRPPREIETLMGLLVEYLRGEVKTLEENDIRFQAIGRPGDLPLPVQEELERATTSTRDNQGMIFNVALSYGSRTEIVDAANRLLARREAGELSGPITEDSFADELYTAGQPDPDLVIRTSGELRLSNFLLWQAAYAELHVTPTLWPDFRKRHLFAAIADFQGRDRRYGGLSEETS
ncbi:MAG: isoprenyl transferase [Acidobacteriota bacterium]